MAESQSPAKTLSQTPSRKQLLDVLQRMEVDLSLLEDYEDTLMPLKLLQKEEKYLLQKSWNELAKSSSRVACRIFQLIFQQSPDAKFMFNFNPDDYERHTQKSNEFTFHAIRFMQVIETTMKLMENLEELRTVLINLGQVHVRVKEQKGFRAHHWSVFGECTLLVFRKEFLVCFPSIDDELDTLMILWRVVLTSIIKTMERAFYRKLHRVKMDRLNDSNDHHLLLEPSPLPSNYRRRSASPRPITTPTQQLHITDATVSISVNARAVQSFKIRRPLADTDAKKTTKDAEGFLSPTSAHSSSDRMVVNGEKQWRSASSSPVDKTRCSKRDSIKGWLRRSRFFPPP